MICGKSEDCWFGRSNIWISVLISLALCELPQVANKKSMSVLRFLALKAVR